jgi:hypothetical protein
VSSLRVVPGQKRIALPHLGLGEKPKSETRNPTKLKLEIQMFETCHGWPQEGVDFPLPTGNCADGPQAACVTLCRFVKSKRFPGWMSGESTKQPVAR